MPVPQLNKISASSIAAFKSCPQKFRLAYVQGLRPEIETDALRTGTAWHGAHEAYANALNEWIMPDFSQTSHPEGEGAYAQNAAIEYLNQRYAEIPTYKTAEEYALEREILVVSMIGYWWYWSERPLEFIASEIPFDLPLHEPRTGMPCSTSSVVRTGKIDHLIRYEGSVCILERKSTSKSLDADSDFWTRWQKDTQVSNYALAFRDMAAAGLLPVEIKPGERCGNTLLDVWKKPITKPKWLTQADTKAFIESGEYQGRAFPVTAIYDVAGNTIALTVDGDASPVERGKKGFAIRETVAMYGARLLAEIYETPEKFFARREIARTDEELTRFRHTLFNIYQSQSLFQTRGVWFENEQSCDTPFRCQFKPICFGGGGADAVSDGVSVPPGFKRLKFADFRVNGRAVEE